MKKPLRKIVIEGETYLWKVRHDHKVLPPEPPQGPGAYGCREVFTAFLESHSASPLRIGFPDGPGRSSGYPAAGVVWTSGAAGLTANLNTPRIAAGLIRLARARGWNPGPSKTPLIIEDGFFLLKELPLEARSSR